MTTVTVCVFTSEGNQASQAYFYQATFDSDTAQVVCSNIVKNFGYLKFTKKNISNADLPNIESSNLHQFSDADFIIHSNTYIGNTVQADSNYGYYLKSFGFDVYDMQGDQIDSSYTYANVWDNSYCAKPTPQNPRYSITLGGGKPPYLLTLCKNTDQMKDQTFINVYDTQENANAQNVRPLYSAILLSTTTLATVLSNMSLSNNSCVADCSGIVAPSDQTLHTDQASKVVNYYITQGSAGKKSRIL